MSECLVCRGHGFLGGAYVSGGEICDGIRTCEACQGSGGYMDVPTFHPYTPGPWRLSEYSPYAVVEARPTGHVVANISGASTDEETRGNARLIAAAPELLAALRALEEAVDLEYGPNVLAPGRPAPLTQARVAARAAIRKAEGAA